jgi:hypothetical protein
MIDSAVYGAGRVAANPAAPSAPPQEGEPAVPEGFPVLPRPPLLLLLVLLVAGACGAAPPPAARSDVERGTALPPPGLNATTTTVRR